MSVLLELHNLSKSYGPVKALSEFGLSLEGGTIHALCGQNGSGKSTLIKILSSYHDPDPGGVMQVRGEDVSFPIPAGTSAGLGIRVVQQDLGIVGSLSVVDNLFAGHYDSRWLIRRRNARELARKALARFGLSVDLDGSAGDLNAGEQAILAITRALMDQRSTAIAEPGVLILDEPTAHLPGPAAARMFQALKAAAESGEAVLIVTHRIEEILEHADFVTVLREGRHIGTRAVADVDHNSLVEMLLGRTLGELYPEHHDETGAEVLKIDGLTAARFHDVSLSIASGEIVGVTGLIGSGFEDLPYAIFGALPSSGEMVLDDEPYHPSSPRDAIASGMGLVPAGRLTQGGVAAATLIENETIVSLKHFTRGAQLDQRKEKTHLVDVLERYSVYPQGSPTRLLSQLSGGNQQKLMMAKWLERNPRVLLLHEPTQGVDIGSRQILFEFVSQAAESGCAVLIASAEYADLASICHEVHVFGGGHVTRVMRGAELEEDRIAEASLQVNLVQAEVGSPP